MVCYNMADGQVNIRETESAQTQMSLPVLIKPLTPPSQSHLSQGPASKCHRHTNLGMKLPICELLGDTWMFKQQQSKWKFYNK